MAEQEQQATGEIAVGDSDRKRREYRGNHRKCEDHRDNRRGDTDDKYIERVVVADRVAKVTRGGRGSFFYALAVVGDDEGTIGVSYGKVGEVPAAIAKDVEETKKSFFEVPIIRRTIVHETPNEGAAEVVLLRPASPSARMIAGDPVHVLMEYAGVHDVLSKFLGSPNIINIVREAVAALRQSEQLEAVAAHRGLPLEGVAPVEMLWVRAEGEAEVCKDVEKAEVEVVASGVNA